MSTWICTIPTPLGRFRAVFSRNGLRKIEFPKEADIAKDTPKVSLHRKRPDRVKQWMKLTERALCSALAGREPNQLPPLDLSGATCFQRKVWTVLQGIPPGQTLTYSEVAKRIGSPKAARPVGRACGANPIPVLIPCHRVISSNNSLGGFSAGLIWKKTLLELEALTNHPLKTHRPVPRKRRPRKS